MEYVKDYKFSGDSGEIGRVAGMLVAPKEFPVERLRDPYSAKSTAVAKAATNMHVNWNKPAPQYQPGQASLQLQDVAQFAAFVFRHPLRHIVYNSLQPAALATYKYHAVFSPNVATPLSDAVPIGTLVRVDPVYFTVDVASAWQPHGDVLFPGYANDRVGFWLDALVGAQMQITYTFTPAPAIGEDFISHAYLWGGGTWGVGEQDTLTGDGITQQFTVQVASSGYWAFEFLAIGASTYTGNYTFTITSHTALGSSWGHLPLGQYWPTNLNNASATRILGVSLLLRNQASPLNRQGNLVIAQIPANEDWYTSYAGQKSAFYDFLFSINGEKDFVLEHGVYGYMKPDGQQSFEFNYDTVLGVANEITTSQFPLAPKDSYLALAATCSQPGGGDCVLEVNAAIEYMTHNQWIDTKVGTVLEQNFTDAVQAIASMQQFYENPTHWSKIMRTIGSIARIAAPITAAIGALTGNPILVGVGAATAGGASALNAYLNSQREEEVMSSDKLKREILAREAIETANMGAPVKAIKLKKRKGH